jgi:thiol:disulfide interchange protein DsbA
VRTRRVWLVKASAFPTEDFSMTRFSLAGFLMALVLPLFAQAEAPVAEPFKQGEHYILIDTPVRQRDPNKIEVVEAFQYSCPHCYRFEPLLDSWKKTLAADVDFYHMPVIWNAPGQLHGQAFYTAQALGALEKVHAPMFDAIHEQNNPLNSKDRIRALFVARGVSAEDFDKTFDSFGVTSQVNQAKARMLSYKIQGTPELIVAGKYRIDGRALGGENATERSMHEKMLQVANFLIEKERVQRKNKPAK